MYFLKLKHVFIIIIISIVDDLALSSNSTKLMNELKENLSEKFAVMLLGKLRSFVSWNISYLEDGMKIYQNGYVKSKIRSMEVKTQMQLKQHSRKLQIYYSPIILSIYWKK